MRKILSSAIIVFMQFSLVAQFPESFEGGVFPPAGWRIFDNGTGQEQSWRRDPKAFMGQQAAFIRWENVPDGQAEDWLVTPRFAPTQQAHLLSFFQKDNYANNYGTEYTVRVSVASATNPADFVVVDRQNESDLGLSYEYHEVNLSAYIGKQIYVAFVMTNDDGDDWLIDEVHLSNCSRPESIQILELFSDGAVFSWESSVGTSWDIDIVESGQIPSGVPAFTGISSPFHWTGGAALNHYDVYLRSRCSLNISSNWYGPFSFYTACSNESCNYKLVLADSYGDDWNDAYIEVIQDGISLGFFTQHEAGFGPYEYYVSLCDTMAFELVWHGGSWDSECIFSFRDLYDQEYFSFSAGNAPSDDAIFFSGKADCSPVTCRFPTHLTASHYNENGARLSWKEKDNANRWDVEFVPLNEEPTGIPTVENISENPYDWTGGEPGTYYQAYVRAACSEYDRSRWSLPVVFTTRCSETNKIFPFSENFTSDFLLPACWISESHNSKSYHWKKAFDSYTQDPMVYCRHENETQDVWLISPPMDFSGINNILTLSFDWKMSYYWMVSPYDKADLHVLVSTDKGQSWSGPLWFENYPGFFESFEWQNSEVDLSSYAGLENVWIAFRYKGKDAASVYLDNFKIDDGSGGITSAAAIEMNYFNIFPNPFSDKIILNFAMNPGEHGLIRITDLQGRTLAVRQLDIYPGDNRLTLSTEDLAPGMYLLSLEMPGGVVTKKIIRME